MTIHLNGQEHTLAADQTLGQLMDALHLPADGVAVAINGEVIPRSARQSCVLKSGDRVEIIQAVGGG